MKDIVETKCKEYERLNTEMMQRMKNLFSQGFTLLTVVGVMWTLASTVCFKCFDNPFTSENFPLTLGYFFITILLFGIPGLFTFPFSVKHHDNLRAVASISAYIKVCFSNCLRLYTPPKPQKANLSTGKHYTVMLICQEQGSSVMNISFHLLYPLPFLFS